MRWYGSGPISQESHGYSQDWWWYGSGSKISISEIGESTVLCFSWFRISKANPSATLFWRHGLIRLGTPAAARLTPMLFISNWSGSRAVVVQIHFCDFPFFFFNADFFSSCLPIFVPSIPIFLAILTQRRSEYSSWFPKESWENLSHQIYDSIAKPSVTIVCDVCGRYYC